jgi:hypothetical protein
LVSSGGFCPSSAGSEEGVTFSLARIDKIAVKASNHGTNRDSKRSTNATVTRATYAEHLISVGIMAMDQSLRR